MKFSEIRQLPTLNGKIQHWNQQQNLPSNSSHAELPDQALPDINGKLLNWFRNHNLPPIPGSCQFLMVNYYSEISIIIYHQIRARSCPNPMVNYVWYYTISLVSRNFSEIELQENLSKWNPFFPSFLLAVRIMESVFSKAL